MQKLSEQEIEILKKQHGEIFEVQVGEKTCYLKKPDRETLRCAMKLGDSDVIEFGEIMLANCWLAGDESIKESNDDLMSLIPTLQNLIEIKTVEIKKY